MHQDDHLDVRVLEVLVLLVEKLGLSLAVANFEDNTWVSLTG